MSIFINPKAEKRKGRKKAFFRSWESLHCSLQSCHLFLAGINIINSSTVSNISLKYAESQTIKDLCYFVWEPPLLKHLVSTYSLHLVFFHNYFLFTIALHKFNPLVQFWLSYHYHAIFSYSYCNFKNIFMPIWM